MTSTTPENDGALAERDVEGDAKRAEGFADRRQVAAVVDILGVHLGDDDKTAEAQPARFLKHSPGVHLDAGRARYRNDHVFDGRERARARCR